MEHMHPVTDDDLRFVIDPETRTISHPSETQPRLIQHDHNSERFTFEIRRIIDGHDVTTCNLVRVHFINISSESKEAVSASIYEVPQSEIVTDSDNEDLVTFSWLIAQEATAYVGTLSFLVELACVDDNHHLLYSWHSGIYDGVIISTGMDNTNAVIGDRYDVLDTWVAQFEDRLDLAGEEVIAKVDEALDKAEDELRERSKVIEADMTVNALTMRSILSQTTGDNANKIMSQKAVTAELRSANARISQALTNKVGALSSAYSEEIDLTKSMNTAIGGVQISGTDRVRFTLYITGTSVSITITEAEFTKVAVPYSAGQCADYTVPFGYLPYNIKPLSDIEVFMGRVHMNSPNNSPSTDRYHDVYLRIKTTGEIRYDVDYDVNNSLETRTPLPIAIPKFIATNDKEGHVALPELIDARLDVNGNVHNSVGEAIRSQIDGIGSEVDNIVEPFIGMISKNDKRITNLEKALNPDPFVTDSAVAYEKVVPANALPYAEINKIGGMTYKSRNHANIKGWNADSTYDADAQLKLSNGYGTTLSSTEGDSITITQSAYPNTSSDLSYENGYATVVLKDSLPINASYKFSFDLKILNNPLSATNMTILVNTGPSGVVVPLANSSAKQRVVGTFAYDGDGTHTTIRTIEFRLAGMSCEIGNVMITSSDDEDTSYEPYFEGLRHAKVTALRSEGANLWNPDVTEIVTKTYSYNTDARDFEENVWYKSLTGNNWWVEYNVENAVVEHNKVSFYCVSSGYGMVRAFKCKPNTKYRILYDYAGEYPDGSSAGFYDIHGNWLSYDSEPSDGITTPENCYWLTICLTAEDSPGNCTFSNIQLAETDVEIPYSPYVGTLDTFIVPEEVQALDGYGLGTPVIANYIECDDDKVEYIQNCKELVYDGTNVYATNAGEAGGYKFVTIHLPYFGIPCVLSYNSVVSTDFNVEFAAKPGYAYATQEGFTTILFYPIDQSIDTPEKANAWAKERYASGKPIKFILGVNTPTVIDITDLISPDNFIKVEPGGRIVAVNEYETDVPTEITYQEKEAT